MAQRRIAHTWKNISVKCVKRIDYGKLGPNVLVADELYMNSGESIGVHFLGRGGGVRGREGRVEKQTPRRKC